MKSDNNVKSSRRRSRLPLKWQLFAAFTAFAAAILALLWAFQLIFLDDCYKLITINRTKRAAANIESNIDSENIQTLVTRIAQDGEMCILVYRPDGVRLADADLLRGCMLHNVLPSERYSLFLDAEANGGEYLNIYSLNAFRDTQYDSDDFSGNVPPADPGMYDSLLYIRIIRNSAGQEVVLMLNSAITPVTATVQTLRTQLVIITVFTVLLALVCAILLSRRLARPISSLNDAAKILATGNYDAGFSADGCRELSELANTLNYAAGELSHVDEYRRELVANVSHDLRTPLTLITGYAEAIRDLPGENTPENMGIVIDEAKRLTALVNDMLDMSKYNDGSMALDRAPFDLSAAISRTVDRYSGFLRQDGYTFSADITPGLTADADESKIVQAVCNLINNAITFTGPDKTVCVSLSRVDNAARFEVTDTGEGIPEDKQAFIWNRYYHFDKTHRRAHTGSGLGLSIVSSVMSLHGARYGVVSSPGRGSTFWFELDCMAS